MESRLLLERHPALRRPDWLPPASRWPELQALRDEHVRLFATHAEAGQAARAIHNRHDAEDETRRDALKDEIRTGEPALLVEVDQDARDDELADAIEGCEAATDALVEFLEEALATIKKHHGEWSADLAQEADATEQRCAEARRVLAEAETQSRELARMGDWLDRAAGRGVMKSHYPFELMELPPVEPEPDWLTIYGTAQPPDEPEPDYEPQPALVVVDGTVAHA